MGVFCKIIFAVWKFFQENSQASHLAFTTR